MRSGGEQCVNRTCRAMVVDNFAGEVPTVSMSGHVERVAAVYESLRTTDEAPVRRIRQHMPDHPVIGLDIGCGTGRYSRLLRGMLPDGSLLVVGDASRPMLEQLNACRHGPNLG